MDHQLDIQKVHNQKYYQQESLIASSDPDVIKIHLQSTLCLNLSPMKKFLTTTREWEADYNERQQSSKHQLHTRKVEGLITYSIDQQIIKFKAIIGHRNLL